MKFYIETIIDQELDIADQSLLQNEQDAIEDMKFKFEQDKKDAIKDGLEIFDEDYTDTKAFILFGKKFEDSRKDKIYQFSHEIRTVELE